MSVHLGIITTPAEAAQAVADEMVKGGIQAIWNFAPVKLRVPENIIVHNEDLYSTLASLSWKLARRFNVPIQEKEAV
jgi:redox-sensing transcriptional repressor